MEKARRANDLSRVAEYHDLDIGSPHLIENASESGEIAEPVRKKVMNELRANFRPEFLNRVDEIVLFKPLTLSEIKRIVGLQLNLLRVRLADRTSNSNSATRRKNTSPARVTTRSMARALSSASCSARSKPRSRANCWPERFATTAA